MHSGDFPRREIPGQDMAAGISSSVKMATGDSHRDAATGPLRKLSVDLIKTYKHINEVRGIPTSFSYIFFEVFNSSVSMLSVDG